MMCDFSFKHYTDTLKEWREEGYIFKTFNNYKSYDKKQIVLRHDIDVSLDSALSMATTEKILGIKSTYMVLVNSSFYNPFSENNINIIKTISEYHDIGVHYDPLVLPENKYSGSRTVMLYAELLEKFIGYNVNISCEHNPIMGKKADIEMINKLGSDYRINNANLLVNARYISDSGMNWREGCFCQHLGKHENIQVLTHPELWVNRNYDEMCDELLDYSIKKETFLFSSLKDNRKIYIERIKTKEN